jgi:hypothetical protein
VEGFKSYLAETGVLTAPLPSKQTKRGATGGAKGRGRKKAKRTTAKESEEEAEEEEKPLSTPTLPAKQTTCPFVFGRGEVEAFIDSFGDMLTL